MKLRPYTTDDYCNGVPCIHIWRGQAETVFPISMSGAHSLDGSRKITYRRGAGVFTKSVGGSDLTTTLYASVTN